MPEPVADDAIIRTHLANERTFLAWLRSAVVLIGAGVAAIALAGDDREVRGLAIGVAIVAVFGGCLLMAWALADYRRNTADIAAGRFRPSSRLPLLATALTGVLAAGVLAVALLVFAED